MTCDSDHGRDASPFARSPRRLDGDRVPLHELRDLIPSYWPTVTRVLAWVLIDCRAPNSWGVRYSREPCVVPYAATGTSTEATCPDCKAHRTALGSHAVVMPTVRKSAIDHTFSGRRTTRPNNNGIASATQKRHVGCARQGNLVRERRTSET